MNIERVTSNSIRAELADFYIAHETAYLEGGSLDGKFHVIAKTTNVLEIKSPDGTIETYALTSRKKYLCKVFELR